jgi:hypothetical protein
MSGVKEFPKMLYHDFYGQRIVETQEEEQELMGKGQGWRSTPQAETVAAPTPAPSAGASVDRRK